MKFKQELLKLSVKLGSSTDSFIKRFLIYVARFRGKTKKRECQGNILVNK